MPVPGGGPHGAGSREWLRCRAAATGRGARGRGFAEPVAFLLLDRHAGSVFQGARLPCAC